MTYTVTMDYNMDAITGIQHLLDDGVDTAEGLNVEIRYNLDKKNDDSAYREIYQKRVEEEKSRVDYI